VDFLRKNVLWVVILLVLSNLMTFIHLDRQADVLRASVSRETLLSAVEASDSALQIYNLLKEQSRAGLVDEKDLLSYSEKVLQIHERLMDLIADAPASRRTAEAKELALHMFRERERAFSNIRSSQQLSAGNFDEVALKNLETASRMRGELMALLSAGE